MRPQAGHPPLDLDIALHEGEVIHGNVGTENRLDFTVIGRRQRGPPPRRPVQGAGATAAALRTVRERRARVARGLEAREVFTCEKAGNRGR